jgi:FSR family fosmidomycin resistance protein-like MFS transporter
MSTPTQAIPQPQSLSPAAPISASVIAPAASTTKLNRLGLFSLVFAHTTVDMQTSSLAVLLPMLLASFNLTYASSAAIISINNLIIAVAQPLFGILGDKRPMRWLLFVGCVLTGTAMVSVLFLPGYPLVLLAVALSGIGSAMYHPEALSTVRAVSGKRQASGTSFFFFGGNLGFALGPFLATTLIALFGAAGELGMLAPTLLAFGVLLTQRRLFQSHVSTARMRAAFTPTARRRVFGLVVFLLALIAVRSTILSGLQTFIPLYYSSMMPKEQYALLVTVLIFSGAFGTLLGGPISERIGRRNTMAGAMVIVLAALFVFLRTEGIAQLIAIAIAGAFITTPWPISVVMGTQSHHFGYDVSAYARWSPRLSQLHTQCLASCP